MDTENFLTNQLVKEGWKSVHICWSCYQTSRGTLFEIQCILRLYYTNSGCSRLVEASCG